MESVLLLIALFAAFMAGLAVGKVLGVEQYDEKLHREGKIMDLDEMKRKVAQMVAEERAR